MALSRSWPLIPMSGRGSNNVQMLVDHIDYAVNLIGIEHVGISSISAAVEALRLE